eukprot:3760522-Prymnesium_polylepis.2
MQHVLGVARIAARACDVVALRVVVALAIDHPHERAEVGALFPGLQAKLGRADVARPVQRAPPRVRLLRHGRPTHVGPAARRRGASPAVPGAARGFTPEW